MAKTKAQIRRLQKRAAARGEEYHPPECEDVENETETSQNGNTTTPEEETNSKRLETALQLEKELKEIEENADMKSKDRRSAKRKAEAIAAEASGMEAPELLGWLEKHKSLASQNSKGQDASDPKLAKREAIAIKLLKEVEEIEKNEELKSKDRRSAKRKAEAIAAEEAGMSSEDLLGWYKTYQETQPKKKDKKEGKRTHDPYIAFVGQLSFETTRDELFKHIQTQLKDEHKVKESDVKIRILTDAKTKKSRGMAFVEVQDPEVLYALLKLHQTFLNGRRINIERSAGGKKNSDSRKVKLAQYRKEQEEYFGGVVDSILAEYKKTGELRDDELDDGVVALCKRHSGAIVEAAVAKYIEGGGRDMDNPSAYLTFLLTKFAEEGIYEKREDSTMQQQGPSSKRKQTQRPNSDRSKKFKKSSELAKSGIDMSISENTSGADKGISRIFPSARRGRGRGYM